MFAICVEEEERHDYPEQMLVDGKSYFGQCRGEELNRDMVEAALLARQTEIDSMMKYEVFERVKEDTALKMGRHKRSDLTT